MISTNHLSYKSNSMRNGISYSTFIIRVELMAKDSHHFNSISLEKNLLIKGF